MFKINRVPNRSPQEVINHKIGVKTLQVQNSPEKTCREIYRITTFYKFSLETNVDPILASSHGFFHPPSPHLIQCFSCSANKSTRNVNCDEQWLRKVHKVTCDFANGKQTGNKPIQSSSPYDVHPNTPPPFQACSYEGLQHSYSSSSVESDLAAPSTSSPNPRNNPPSEVPSSNQASQRIAEILGPSTPSPPAPSNTSMRSSLLSLFPCEFPANSMMTSKEARLQTFVSSGSLWWKFSSQLRATPSDLAEAGFYYLGDRDRVKCWYCDGGLQGWERNDEPWEEHTKWFPKCEFVLQQKGPEYIHKVVTKFPNLKRPSSSSQNMNTQHYGRPPSESSRNHFEPSQWISTFSRGSHSRRQSGVVEIVDPQVERRNREERIEREMRGSEHVTQMKGLGFKEGQIKLALRRQFERHNKVFNSLEDFLEAVLNLPNAPAPHRTPKSSTVSNSYPHQRSSEDVQESINTGRCKLCHSSPANLVFLPCGHLVCCISCGNELDSCLVCGSYIGEKIHSYIS